jgi:hypothetical protein
LFNFNEEYISYAGLELILRRIMIVVDKLRGINQKRGYVNTIDIFSADYPIVNILAKKLFSSSEE